MDIWILIKSAALWCRHPLTLFWWGSASSPAFRRRQAHILLILCSCLLPIRCSSAFLSIFLIIAFTAARSECWARSGVAVRMLCTLSLLGIAGLWGFCIQLKTKAGSSAPREYMPLGVQACLLAHTSCHISPELLAGLQLAGLESSLILKYYRGLCRDFVYLGHICLYLLY